MTDVRFSEVEGLCVCVEAWDDGVVVGIGAWARTWALSEMPGQRKRM